MRTCEFGRPHRSSRVSLTVTISNTHQKLEGQPATLIVENRSIATIMNIDRWTLGIVLAPSALSPRIYAFYIDYVQIRLL